MKNNLKFIVFLFFWAILIGHNKTYANEILFNTSEIRITDNGNITNTGPGSAYSQVDNIKIDGQSFKLDKNSSLLIANNAKTTLSEKNIEIIADQLIYDKKISTIQALGNVEVKDLSNNIILRSEEVTYNKNKKIIFSNVRSTFTDMPGNNFITEQFFYTLNDNLLKISKTKITDIQKNTYYLERGFLNLITNKLTGKDISVDFNSLAINNEPRMVGRSVSSDKDKTVIEKGVFTTCKKNDDCPPWEFLAKKITHDKKKKTINYENAWLKIYDKPVFYFPKFFHPDPTVKRQSGFLMPSFSGSNSTGSAFTLPYFHVISNQKDLTFSPRLYSAEKILAQSEYRSVNKKTKHIIDFSVLSDKSQSSKTHFFSKSKKELDSSYFDNSDLSIDLQYSSSDTYLKSYKLDSPLINSDTGTLTSTFGFNGSKEDLSLEVDFIVYENLSDVSNSDKYEYVYPSYNFKKDLYDDLLLSGNFNLNSSGYIKIIIQMFLRK